MKIHLLAMVCLFILIVMSTDTLAQITITSTDATAINAVGHVITNHFDSTTTSVDIGSPGATSWDFSALNSHTSNTFTSVVPSSTPYYSSDFLTSNVAFIFTEIIQGINADGWQYSTQNSGDYLMNGVVVKSVIGTDTLVLKSIYLPTQLDLPLPFTYNSQWNSDFVIGSTTYFNGIPFGTSYFNHTETVIVDAYGPITMPGGTVSEALRVRRDDRYTFAGGASNRTISYSFITKSGSAVEIVATDTTASNSGIIQTEGVTWSNSNTTGVDSENQIPIQFSLSQNYPNPFNPSTTIKYQIPNSSFVSIKVYNTLGREVATLINEEKSTGSYQVEFNANGLSSGIYFCRIQAGNFSETKKLTLMK